MGERRGKEGRYHRYSLILAREDISKWQGIINSALKTEINLQYVTGYFLFFFHYKSTSLLVLLISIRSRP